MSEISKKDRIETEIFQKWQEGIKIPNPYLKNMIYATEYFNYSFEDPYSDSDLDKVKRVQRFILYEIRTLYPKDTKLELIKKIKEHDPSNSIGSIGKWGESDEYDKNLIGKYAINLSPPGGCGYVSIYTPSHETSNFCYGPKIERWAPDYYPNLSQLIIGMDEW